MLTRTSVRVMALSPLVVMLLWSSHFYTVYMATLGAALVILARALTMDGSWRTGVLGLLRVGIVMALGIGLTAPLLIPTFKILKAATPSPGLTFEPAPTWSSWPGFSPAPRKWSHPGPRCRHSHARPGRDARLQPPAPGATSARLGGDARSHAGQHAGSGHPRDLARFRHPERQPLPGRPSSSAG